MKVLVACEESQEVCKAFRSLGHEAYSCDIQEPSGGHPDWHILGDALKAINGGIIAEYARSRDDRTRGRRQNRIFTREEAERAMEEMEGAT